MKTDLPVELPTNSFEMRLHHLGNSFPTSSELLAFYKTGDLKEEFTQKFKRGHTREEFTHRLFGKVAVPIVEAQPKEDNA